MITWVTVWVLTVQHINDIGVNGKNSHVYQLTYATREICMKQKKFHETSYKVVRCDFQQVPVYAGGR